MPEASTKSADFIVFPRCPLSVSKYSTRVGISSYKRTASRGQQRRRDERRARRFQKGRRRRRRERCASRRTWRS